MMKMRAGIGLHNMLARQFDVVSINSGTQRADVNDGGRVDFGDVSFIQIFEDDAILPKQDWRALTRHEKEMLIPKGLSTSANTIVLGQLTENQISLFEDLGLADAGSLPDIYSILRRKEEAAKRVSDELNTFLSGISGGKPHRFHCFGASYPNLASVSGQFSMLQQNHYSGNLQYIGLHNDCTSEMTIGTVHTFGNRISINLGKEPREFLFVNLYLMQAYVMIRKKIAADTEGPRLAMLANTFFTLFPEYPVLKIKLEPYQYYIAPTNNCFHDAQTLNNVSLDITMVLFGNFYIPQITNKCES
jgi:hypothetical protein